MSAMIGDLALKARSPKGGDYGGGFVGRTKGRVSRARSFLRRTGASIAEKGKKFGEFVGRRKGEFALGAAGALAAGAGGAYAYKKMKNKKK